MMFVNDIVMNSETESNATRSSVVSQCNDVYYTFIHKNGYRGVIVNRAGFSQDVVAALGVERRGDHRNAVATMAVVEEIKGMSIERAKKSFFRERSQRYLSGTEIFYTPTSPFRRSRYEAILFRVKYAKSISNIIITLDGITRSSVVCTVILCPPPSPSPALI